MSILSDATRRKANAFVSEAEAAGWEVETRSQEDEAWVRAVRESEQIVLWWYGEGGSFGHPSTYRFGSDESQVPNVADARRKLTGTPKVSGSRGRRAAKSAGTREVPRMVMPFELDTLREAVEEVKSHLWGATLVWQNRFSGDIEEATVPPRERHEIDSHGRKIRTVECWKLVTLSETSSGSWVLTFPAVHGSFRSVALEEILQVR